MPDQNSPTNSQHKEHSGMSLVRFLWCLPEIGLLGVLIFLCLLFGIHQDEIVYHAIFSLSTFAAIRCVESVIRIDERVSQCGQFARACRILHLRTEEQQFDVQLESYKFKRAMYGLFSFGTLCWWIIGAAAYVYVLKNIHSNVENPAWLNRFVGGGTAFFVVTAVVKSGLAVWHDDRLNVVLVAQLTKEKFGKPKSISASSTGS